MSERFDYIKYSTEFLDKIKKKGIPIEDAVLFGSYAKNTYNDDSDIDILLVSDSFKGVGFIDNLLIADELIEYSMINVKTYSTEDYKENDPLIEEINKTGLSLINPNYS